MRLLTRTNHPTIDNPELAVSLLEKFSGLWEEPRLEEVRHTLSCRNTVLELTYWKCISAGL